MVQAASVNPVPLVLRDRIRLRVDAVDKVVLTRLKAEFEHANPQYVIKKRIGRGWWDEEPVITTWRETPDGSLELPRGGLQRVRNVLWDAGLDWEILDTRTSGAGPRGEIPAYKSYYGPMWAHQLAQMDVAVERENCIIRSATGTGKTSTLLALAARINLPTLVVVPTSGLFKQWRERAELELGLGPRECGYIHEDRTDLAPLTIALQASLAARRKDGGIWLDILGYFGVLLADEVQYAPARTFFDAFDGFPARYRIGMSASEKRKDRQEFLAYDLFGPMAHEYTREQGIADKVIIDVEARVIPTDFRADWYGLESDEKPETKGKELDFDRLLKEMAADGARTQLMVDAVAEEVRAGSICIVYAHHTDLVRQFDQRVSALGIKTGILLGGKENGAEFDRAKRGLKDGSVQVAVGTYKATGTGIDIPRVDVVACLTPIAANEGEVNQVRGRACRRGKDSARMLYLLDRLVWPRHLSNLTRWCPGALIREGSEWVPAKKRR